MAQAPDVVWTCISEKKAKQCAILVAINTPALLDLWVAEAVSSTTGVVPVSGLTECDYTALPGFPESFLPGELRNGLGQDLCQPGERSKVIVLCDTMLKGAVMKSAVIVACRAFNEASAFTLLFIVCHSGTLCSLFTDS